MESTGRLGCACSTVELSSSTRPDSRGRLSPQELDSEQDESPGPHSMESLPSSTTNAGFSISASRLAANSCSLISGASGSKYAGFSSGSNCPSSGSMPDAVNWSLLFASAVRNVLPSRKSGVWTACAPDASSYKLGYHGGSGLSSATHGEVSYQPVASRFSLGSGSPPSSPKIIHSGNH